MKKYFGLLLFIAVWGCSSAIAADLVPSLPRFGKVSLYKPAGAPSGVVLFISGDGGWTPGVENMAKELSALGALVVGIDIRFYLKAMASGKESCAYPAADFEALSQYIQKQQGLPGYLTPVLIGYSSGATLVYAVLAQAPGSTFAGGISLGFCPDLDTPKPLCKGAGLTWTRQKNSVVFDPVKHLKKPWITFQGDIDQVCDAAKTKAFVAQVPNGRNVELPNVGHGFAVFKNWLPQFKDAYRKINGDSGKPAANVQPPAAAVGDLPLTEVPPRGHDASRMAVFFSGDGGWADLDQGVSAVLADKGIPVVGVNSLKYFWKKRSPEESAADMDRIITHYADKWKRDRVILVGYSFGADVMPFMASRLSPSNAEKVELIALLGPSRTAAFEFQLTDWIGGSAAGNKPVEPEIRKLTSTPILCLCGDEESDSLCRAHLPGNVTAVALKGAHHFGGDYQQIGRDIIGMLKP